MTKKKDAPTVSDEFQTEQSAITVFRELLPAKWILRKQDPDFHLDYLVEVVDAGELTGIHIGVQLKGWQRKKHHDGPPKYSLKTKHLAYYVDKCTSPVFLILVDVVKREAYWVFMQKFGKDLKVDWRKQKKITVEFDEAQMLSNHDALIEAVENAVKYVRDIHPSSIKAAVSHAEKVLAAKDNRVDVKIDVVDGIQKVKLLPKESFPFSLKFKTADPATVESIKNFIEKGNDLKIKSSEIEFVGAPHLEALSATEGELTIQHRIEHPGHALLSWDEKDVLAQVHIPGRFWAGVKFISFDASLADAPLRISGTISPETWNNQEPFSMEFGLRPQNWQGQPLLALAHFESVYNLVKALNGDLSVVLRFFIKGNFIGKARMDRSSLSDLSGFWDLLEIFRKARMLATHFQVSPVVPNFEALGSEGLDAVEELYSIVFEDGHRKKVPNVTVSANILGTVPTPQGDAGTLAIVSPEQTYSLFGTAVKLGKVETHLNHLTLTEKEPSSSGSGTRVTFTGTNESERVIRLVKADFGT